MASVIKLTTNGRNGWRVRFYLDKKRKELYLAGVSKKIADAVAYHCSEITGAMGANTNPSPKSAAWAAGTDGKLRESLVAWGMAEPASAKLSTDAGRLLGAFLTAYITGRTDVKRTTFTNYMQTRRLLIE